MKIETMLYVYLAVCAGMIVFNIVAALVFRYKDKRTLRISEDFRYQVTLQLMRVEQGQPVESRHKKYLQRKLKRVGNMIAFDRMLEKTYAEHADIIKDYLSQLDSVFIALTIAYCGKDRIEAAYFPYIIKKYRLIAFRSFPSIEETLLGMLREPSIYCRENAMQALYTTGDADCIVQAVRIIDSSDLFFHGKLLADGMLNFAGNKRELDDMLTAQFNCFSDEMKVTLLNYLRFSTDRYREFAYQLLCDEDENDEIRYACIRYLGKFRFDEAYPKLCELAGSGGARKWEYAAIASTALGIYPGEKTVELLKNNLYSQNWYVRFNSSESLERLGLTYEQLVDVIDGKDRYAAEIIRYRLEHNRNEEGREAGLC